MVSRRKGDEPVKPRRPPGTTPEARENQLIAAAVDLAEKQLLEGTASSQVISLYLKLGSTRERLEQQRLREENALLAAKVEQLSSMKNSEEMYTKALQAMSNYQGKIDDEFEFE